MLPMAILETKQTQLALWLMSLVKSSIWFKALSMETLW
jgi:hypothetical protein